MEFDQLLTQIPQYQTLMRNVASNSRQLVTGSNGSATTLLLATIVKNQHQPIIVICDTLYHADQLVSDLVNVLPPDMVYEFPVEEMIAAELATSSPAFRSQRVLALNQLLSGQPAVIVTAVSGLRRLLPSPEQFKAAKLKLTIGDEVDLTQLRLNLHQMGYVNQKMVAAPGEYSIRGSIVDVYPLNNDYPVRLDFFDTEVDSMRIFDSADQRSIENIAEVEILPASDILITDVQRQILVKKLTDVLKKETSQANAEQAALLTDHVESQITDIQAGLADTSLVLYSQWLYEQPTTLLDYLSTDGITIFDDYSRLQDADRDLAGSQQNWLADEVKAGKAFQATHYTTDLATVFKADQHAQILLSLFQKGLGKMRLDDVVDLTTRPMQQFFSQMPMLKTEVGRWQKQKQTVIMLVDDELRVQKVAKTMADFEIAVTQTTADNIIPETVQIISGQLHNGFELPEANLAIITEKELFGQVTKKRPSHQTFNNAERIKSYTDLKPGDYVVHVNHGIGRYEGMKTMEVDGKHQDYLTITYRDNAQIFIPVTQLNLIQKYVSADDKTPKINKLGGSEWAKTKQKVAAKIEDIADDLIELYAARSAEKGYAYPKDDALQNEFEAAFPYSETGDQLRSTAEIKHDMEQSRPMDRLLVGDVGYGKTEVALRAAFKAIEVGKQVAFLVPTTILAQQHYETMVSRFNNFAVEVRVLSRFQTRAEVKDTLAGLADGSVDIVVGTHRLLSKDVKFKDLGMLIIDEEQRFGVKHKERIKQLRSDVDVLTLTATPIPRTLNMSMMGVRDLSLIETPPANRYPIQTYVMEQNPGAIIDGIQREMQRGGQVFYLHNRVEDIEQVVANLEELVPDARVGYIHGQMTEVQMENILYDFVNGEYDVLVTTTIIETGVDIPNVNTLFVENADKMGLSQLYQLRGRIGRSSRVAYAYFMYQPNKVLTEVGEKRLEAIRDFTELGSGFKIAMRDLSIRGAGNLLGKQQHGFVDSVGYDLYTQMLSDAVAKKQGKKVVHNTDAALELAVEAYLPDEYIEDKQHKIELYKRIRQVQNQEQLDEVVDDLIDRFGEYPPAVANLLAVEKLKLSADAALVTNIRQRDKQLTINFDKRANTVYDGEELFKAISMTDFRPKASKVDDHYVISLIIQPKLTDWFEQLTKLMTILADYRREKLTDGD
ncbi:transcription-repair coupling factor [Lentilactobacillus kribbianus]|uniref:transcription-repair coupling factor n=1 Tax=Lentilactobacillus kribbianus TaxID=2729622 RepID=UPI00248431F7|nr:transcription-repair coupling factor [Lentilactobacillus kribbianus]